MPARLITDAALWSDVSEPDARARDGNTDGPPSDRGSIPVDGASAEVGAVGEDAGQTCALLGASCVGREACYPLPFEGPPNGGTQCALQGIGGPSVPCQSQVECDGTTLCSAPQAQADSVCSQRCNLANPRCPTGMQCAPYFAFAGVGVCL